MMAFNFSKAVLSLSKSNVTIFLKLKEKYRVDKSKLSMSINNTPVDNWEVVETELLRGEVQLSGSPIMKWELAFESSELSQDTIEDILILIGYTAAALSVD